MGGALDYDCASHDDVAVWIFAGNLVAATAGAMRPFVILGENYSATGSNGHGTLDDLFRRASLRRPAEWALIDPPNRRAFADGAPRYVSYAAADRFVSALAGRLHRLGLPRDSVVAIQCTNMVESTLALLGVLRAGMIAAPLPLLWRH